MEEVFAPLFSVGGLKIPHLRGSRMKSRCVKNNPEGSRGFPELCQAHKWMPDKSQFHFPGCQLHISSCLADIKHQLEFLAWVGMHNATPEQHSPDDWRNSQFARAL